MFRIPRPLGLLLIALLLAAVLMPTLPGTTYWHRVLQDLGHGVVFAGIAVVLLAMRPAETASVLGYGRTFAIAVARVV